jgi:uncharacterized protein (DUF1330 family)
MYLCGTKPLAVLIPCNFGVLMSYEILVGLHVLDDLKYDDYRNAMKPILSDYQGHFGYDFKVSEVLISEGDSDINRVFTINFSNKNNMEGFFADTKYLTVKEQYFVASVASTTIISSYEKDA